jgi:hypothetical protein
VLGTVYCRAIAPYHLPQSTQRLVALHQLCCRWVCFAHTTPFGCSLPLWSRPLLPPFENKSPWAAGTLAAKQRVYACRRG